MSWASASAAITAKAAGYLLGGAGLGPPITGVTAVAGTEGFAQRFAAGTVYWSFLYGACVVGNEVDARYRELGGPAPRPDGWLGVPIGDEVPVASGGYVRFEFQGAGLAYHPAHGTHVVYGLIGEHYWHVLGGPAGAWGFPLTDEYQDGNGRASDFEGGTLFRTATASWRSTHPTRTPPGSRRLRRAPRSPPRTGRPSSSGGTRAAATGPTRPTRTAGPAPTRSGGSGPTRPPATRPHSGVPSGRTGSRRTRSGSGGSCGGRARSRPGRGRSRTEWVTHRRGRRSGR